MCVCCMCVCVCVCVHVCCVCANTVGVVVGNCYKSYRYYLSMILITGISKRGIVVTTCNITLQ